jgi:phosphoglycolate phosphatase
MRLCCERENQYLSETGGILFPKLEDTLKQLMKDYGLYIVSNCQVGYIEAFLEHYQFQKYFLDTENFGNTGKLKAHNIKLIVDRNYLEQAVYVGDTMGDYIATMEVGLPFIHVAYGFGEVPQAVYKINQFAELPQVIKEIGRNQ